MSPRNRRTSTPKTTPPDSEAGSATGRPAGEAPASPIDETTAGGRLGLEPDASDDPADTSDDPTYPPDPSEARRPTDDIEATRSVTDVQTLKVLGNPLRVRILEALTTHPMSAKELAEALGESQTKLYRHIHLLEVHDLVKVVETRVVSGLDERVYRATAYKFILDRSLVSFDAPAGRHALDALLSYVLDETKRDIQRSIGVGIIDLSREVPDPRSLYTRRLHVRLTPQMASNLQRQLEALVNDAMEQSSDSNDQLFAMSLVFYPTGGASQEGKAAGSQETPPSTPPEHL